MITLYALTFFVGFGIGFAIQAILTTAAERRKPNGTEFDEHEGLGV